MSLAIIATIAALLRAYGLRWGLPNALHAASYHPDEFLVVGAALGVYAGQAVIPRFYNYPSLFIYLVTFAVALAAGLGMDITLGNVYLAARVVSVAMGTIAVVVTYWAGRVWFNKGAGVIASLLLAITPIHVQHSHFATVDASSTVFVAAALGFAGLVFKRGSWRDYVLAGVMAGLAAGTKYNAGMVMLAVVAAHFLRTGLKWRTLRAPRLWAAIGCTLAIFVASTPGVILRFGDFWYGFSYELAHSAAGHGLVFAGTGNGFIYTFTSSLWYGVGPWLAALFLVAAVWAVVKRDRGALILLAFIVPYYALISISQVRFARYAIPMLPAIALLIGWFVGSWLERYRGWTPKKGIVLGVLAGVVVSTASYTLALDRLFAGPDPRDQAARWMFEHAPKGSSVGLIDAPWFYSPPLSPSFGAGALPQREESAYSTPYDITLFAKCDEPGCWMQNPPKWVITSDYETGDALRLQRNKSISKEAREQVRRTLSDVKLIRENYIAKKQFSGSLRCYANSFGETSKLPHDMRYTSPTITIYERKQ